MSTSSSYLLGGEERQRGWLMVSSIEMFRFLILLSLVATSLQSVNANPKIPTTAASSNLFNEYITRGLFTCTRDYVKSLTDLHVLMRELYDNYQSCKQQVKDVDKTYPQTPFAYLNDLMRRYQMADKPKEMEDIEKEIIAGPKKTSH